MVSVVVSSALYTVSNNCTSLVDSRQLSYYETVFVLQLFLHVTATALTNNTEFSHFYATF